MPGFGHARFFKHRRFYHEWVEYGMVNMVRFEGGKLSEIWETRNTFGIMRQPNPEIGGDHHGH